MVKQKKNQSNIDRVEKKNIFLFLCLFQGNLIDKHVIILKNNPHYKNVHIPEPDTIEPLEQKFPYVSEKSLDFMKVKQRQKTNIQMKI